MWYVIFAVYGMTCAVGYLFFGGKLYQKRFEKELKISAFWYVLAAVVCGVSGLLFCRYGYGELKATRLLFLMGALFPIGMTDKREQIIPNQIVLLLFVVRAAVLIAECVSYSNQITAILLSAGLGALYGSVVFLVARIFSKDCIGMGDVKLFAVIGFYVGSTSVFFTMLLSLIIALVGSLILVMRKKLTLKDTISFGPYIAIGTIISLILGV